MAAPVVHQAATGRVEPDEAPVSPVSQPQGATASAPEPDLDSLARQVYAVLKRRLATEFRQSR
jgi:hypothetical protein